MAFLSDNLTLILLAAFLVSLFVVFRGIVRIIRLWKLYKAEKTVRHAASLLTTTITTVVFFGIGFVATDGLYNVGPPSLEMNRLVGHPAPELVWSTLPEAVQDEEATSASEAQGGTESNDVPPAVEDVAAADPASAVEPIEGPASEDPGTEDGAAVDTVSEDTVPEDVAAAVATMDLTALKGKVVLVNLWATWCPPCIAEMPDLDQLQQDFGDRGLQVLHLSDEPEEVLVEYLQENPMTTMHGRIETFPWPTAGRPTTYIVDRDGVVQRGILGSRPYETFADLVGKFL